jgi:hypothetical protein
LSQNISGSALKLCLRAHFSSGLLTRYVSCVFI